MERKSLQEHTERKRAEIGKNEIKGHKVSLYFKLC
jgi:hypothetical protein